MAHPDLDELINVVLPFAQNMLGRHGEFYPFGASKSADGEIANVAAYTEDERPSSNEVVDRLISGFRTQANSNELGAAAVCFDVRVTPPGEPKETDAICVRLEHLEGDAVQVFLPYRKGWFGRYRFGELFAVTGEREIFD